MTRVAVWLFALAIFALAPRALAHSSATAHLEIVEDAPGEAVVTLRAPPGARLGLEPPEGCLLDQFPGSQLQTAMATARLHCAQGLAGSTLGVTGMDAGSGIIVLARVVLADGGAHGAVLTARAPSLVVPGREGARATLARFTRYGVEHVLSGIDHLLFLVALFWQARGAARPGPGVGRRMLGELASTATAFTLAHSMTLGATALGWLHVPSRVAEACIAWSLVLIALDGWKSGAEVASRSRASRMGLVAVFGLAHGLGFASALSEAHIPEHAIVPALVAFNVGVEIGQALFLAACVVSATLAARAARTTGLFDGRGTLRDPASRAATLSAYVVGCTGAYLFVDRTLPFLHNR